MLKQMALRDAWPSKSIVSVSVPDGYGIDRLSMLTVIQRHSVAPDPEPLCTNCALGKKNTKPFAD